MATRSNARPMAGVALLLVLWCTAALAVLVTGMVGTQRTETRLAAAARARVEASAAGRAAIEQVVQQVVGSATPVDRLHRRWVTFDGQTLAVDVLPMSGLIDLTKAPASLLTDLFVYAGGVPESVASRLAADVETRRQRKQPVGSPRDLEAAEELLAIEGFDMDLLGRIEGLVTVGGNGSGKVNPLCAPDGVLVVLARGDAAVSARFAAARDAGDPAIDATGFQVAHVDGATGSRFRFSAVVPRPDGGQVVVVRDIDIHHPQAGGPPWRTLAGSTRIALPGVPRQLRGDGV